MRMNFEEIDAITSLRLATISIVFELDNGNDYINRDSNEERAVTGELI
jgi:hypothetical protein